MKGVKGPQLSDFSSHKPKCTITLKGHWTIYSYFHFELNFAGRTQHLAKIEKL